MDLDPYGWTLKVQCVPAGQRGLPATDNYNAMGMNGVVIGNMWSENIKVRIKSLTT